MALFDFLAEKLADAMIAIGVFIASWCKDHKKAAVIIGIVLFILIDIAVIRKRV
jgi:hypothetical protein